MKWIKNNFNYRIYTEISNFGKENYYGALLWIIGPRELIPSPPDQCPSGTEGLT